MFASSENMNEDEMKIAVPFHHIDDENSERVTKW